MSVAGGLPFAIARAHLHECEALQIFTKNANQWRARPLGDDEIAAFRHAAADTGIQPIVSHASYLINIATTNPALRAQSLAALGEEVDRAEALGLMGVVLHPGARIGSHFFVDHGTGTVVGETAIIGNHVKMYHGVTLGARSTSGGQQLRGKKRHPTIEDRVTIYPGATILGGETVIGAGSTIGGNVFIMDSVAPNSLVIYDGLDMRVLSKNDKNGALDFQI